MYNGIFFETNTFCDENTWISAMYPKTVILYQYNENNMSL
jgi:hypothetical protein